MRYDKEDLVEYCLERAAIMEYDGGLSRGNAEFLAKEEAREKFMSKGVDNEIATADMQ